MKYAVVVAGSKQLKVAEGDEVLIDRFEGEAGGIYNFPKVLLVVDAASRTVGKPVVEGVSVTGTILGHEKGDKLRVAKFKANARYRRVKGYRHSFTKIKVEKIVTRVTSTQSASWHLVKTIVNIISQDSGRILGNQNKWPETQK